MVNIPTRDAILYAFNLGRAFWREADSARQVGELGQVRQELALNAAAREGIGALEWACKHYLTGKASAHLSASNVVDAALQDTAGVLIRYLNTTDEEFRSVDLLIIPTQFYDRLQEVACNHALISYCDVADLVGLQLGNWTAWNKMAVMLSTVSEIAHSRDQPLLSAVVVDNPKAQQPLPLEGFFKLAEYLGRTDANQPPHEFWGEEIARVYSGWQWHEVDGRRYPNFVRSRATSLRHRRK